MTDLEPLLRFWRAQDEALERVDPFWWGAVVSDVRFPHVQEANYARLETREPVRLAEVEGPLRTAMRRSGASRAHVVVFHPDEQTDLLAAASTRGEHLTWDLVMEHPGEPPPSGEPPVEEVAFTDAFATAHRGSMRWFDIVDPVIVEELAAMERTVFVAGGRRWFVVREDGEPVAFAGLWVLEGVGYLDHVVTVPGARRRGFASALAAAAVRAAHDAGAERTYLLAEPEGGASRLYARLGFRDVTQIASWISPV